MSCPPCLVLDRLVANYVADRRINRDRLYLERITGIYRLAADPSFANCPNAAQKRAERERARRSILAGSLALHAQARQRERRKAHFRANAAAVA
jgi:hypothetical protein